MYCWGSNRFGESEVKYNISTKWDIVEVGLYFTCSTRAKSSFITRHKNTTHINKDGFQFKDINDPTHTIAHPTPHPTHTREVKHTISRLYCWGDTRPGIMQYDY